MLNLPAQNNLRDRQIAEAVQIIPREALANILDQLWHHNRALVKCRDDKKALLDQLTQAKQMIMVTRKAKSEAVDELNLANLLTQSQ